METIKSYTDLEQSKKLAEILPVESADMTYCAITEGMREKMTIKNWEVNVGLDIAIRENLFSYRNGYVFPCWSLAALLKVIPKKIKDFNVLRIDINEKDFSIWYDEIGSGVNTELPDITMECPVDACYEMIIRLHELKML